MILILLVNLQDLWKVAGQGDVCCGSDKYYNVSCELLGLDMRWDRMGMRLQETQDNEARMIPLILFFALYFE